MAIKIVEFDKWCYKCNYFEKREDEDPCCDCLNQGWNEDSHKPIRFKEKSEEDKIRKQNSV